MLTYFSSSHTAIIYEHPFKLPTQTRRYVPQGWFPDFFHSVELQGARMIVCCQLGGADPAVGVWQV